MIKLFKRFTKREVSVVLISIVLISLQVWLELKIPDYMSNMTTIITTQGSTTNDVLIEGGKMLLCALASLASAVVVGYMIAHLSASFSRHLRESVFDKVIIFGEEQMKKFSTSSLITRTTNDITQIQTLISIGMQAIIKAPIMAVSAVVKILNKSWTWSMITGGGVLAILIVVIILLITVLPKFKIIQKLTDKLNQVTSENLKGIRVIRAFNAEQYQEKKFDNVNNELTKTNLFANRLTAIIGPVMSFIMPVLTLAIYYTGAIMINNAALVDKMALFSNMVVFSSYVSQIIMSFIMLVMIFIIYPRADISAKRINEVLDTETTIKEGTEEVNPKEKGTIEFKNVSFKYPDAEEYTFENVSFKVKQGETIAFIGSTGSGKSTLINMIPRFYDTTDGTILIDGINVKDYKLNDLYNRIGYISQKPVLFSGTVESNIKLGTSMNGKPNKEEITKAVQVAQADEFVLNMPKKYQAHIASGGTNISGGQKQRLSIARAIARNPEIYIFDDAFSALDYATDAKLREDLREYAKDATVLIVAQRIGTIQNADKIIVLDNGKVVGMGTHEKLLKTCRVYREIAESQLSKEELYA